MLFNWIYDKIRFMQDYMIHLFPDKKLLSITKDPLDIKQKEIVDQVSTLLGTTAGLLSQHELEHSSKSTLHGLSKSTKDKVKHNCI